MRGAAFECRPDSIVGASCRGSLSALVAARCRRVLWAFCRRPRGFRLLLNSAYFGQFGPFSLIGAFTSATCGRWSRETEGPLAPHEVLRSLEKSAASRHLARDDSPIRHRSANHSPWF